ncbi:MAG: outer membrane beta-barrel protein [Desulfobacterium sp.]|nr:outer membrane beta-barrel protein [Desulfobacterium sp.]
MKKEICTLMVVLFGLGIWVSPLHAGESPFSLRLSGYGVPSLSGDAGEGDNAPGYDDAFDMGLGLSVEGVYRLNEKFSLLLGLGYESHSGETYNDISFDDFKAMPVYVGAIYQFTAARSGWIPYLRGDVGMVSLDSVDISYLGTSIEYWDSSWEPMFDFGVGAEYRRNSLGFFLEIKARYMDSPSASLRPFSDSDANWSLPLSVGVSIYF